VGNSAANSETLLRAALEIGVDLPARVPPLTTDPVSVEAALGSFASQRVGAYAKAAGELVVGDKRLAEWRRRSLFDGQRDRVPSIGAQLGLIIVVAFRPLILAAALGRGRTRELMPQVLAEFSSEGSRPSRFARQ
jgi:hypothetical protein